MAETLFLAMAWTLIVLTAVLALVTLFETVLGILVLRRGGGRLAGFFLGAYLVLQSLAWGLTLLAAEVSGEGLEFPGYLEAIGVGGTGVLRALSLSSIALLPALLLGFALTFPGVHPWLRGRRWIAALPLLVSGAIIVTLVDASSGGANAPAVVAGLVYQAVGSGLASFLFASRLRAARTALEARRLRLMLRSVALPTALASVGLVALFAASGGSTVSETLFLLILFGSMVLVTLLVLAPAMGLAFTLLRYRLVELDRGFRPTFRFTLSHGFIAALLLAAFVLVEEIAAELLTSGTESTLLGIGGACLVAMTFTPLERFAMRLAGRVVPPKGGSAGNELRRREVYRATYEDLSSDGVVNARERRALGSLARSLGLSAGEVESIHLEVGRERATRKGGGAAARAPATS